jgi:hypothetical protein
MVRCPACQHTFRVPDPNQMLDESVVCWLDLDIMDQKEDEEAARQRAEQDAARAAAEQDAAAKQQAAASSAAQSADAAAKPVAKPTPQQAPAKSTASVPPATRSAATPGDREPHEADQLSLDEAMSEFETRGTSHGSFVALDLEDVGAAEGSAKPASGKSDDSKRTAHDVTPMRLTVRDVGAFGVRLAFDSGMFRLPGFRGSLPMKCLMCGETEPTRLIAKPLAWVDRVTGRSIKAGELEARYEWQVKSQESASEIAQSMATLDELPPPFNQPIPYFACRRCAGKVTVHCETVPTREGVCCEVVIPSGRYALDWLGRVNGVCGEDYLALEAEAMKFEAKAWRAIPQHVRARLGVWFDFKGDERFCGYFIDGDFSKSDAGLAGLIVTDKRLVHCKYHNHGEIPFSKGGDLIVVDADRFVDLKYRNDDATRRLVRLRKPDLAALAKLLEKLGNPFRMLQAKPSGDTQSAQVIRSGSGG